MDLRCGFAGRRTAIKAAAALTVGLLMCSIGCSLLACFIFCSDSAGVPDLARTHLRLRGSRWSSDDLEDLQLAFDSLSEAELAFEHREEANTCP